MNATECIKKMSPVLFWDVDKSQADMDKYPSFFVQRVLEYGNWSDWKLLLCYYGKDRIVDICKNLRSLDSKCLSYICAISNTRKEEYRCYQKYTTMRTNIEHSPLKREIESIFNPRNIDTDCDTIANLLCSFKEVINKDMSKGNYNQAFDTFLEILDSLSNHFVEDEHFCYFDDMHSPDYTCSDILKSIISQIKNGKVSSEDVE